MACDGDIDDREIELVRKLASDKKLFGDTDMGAVVAELSSEIGDQGYFFLRRYIDRLEEATLTENQQISIVDIAVKTIEADDQVDYAEVKFFKILRSKLSVSDEAILDKLPGKEKYLEQDIISPSYLQRMQTEFFLSTHVLGEVAFSSNQLDVLLQGKPLSRI
jgi:uncharacterized tellurite resistance protein B-like protein